MYLHRERSLSTEEGCTSPMVVSGGARGQGQHYGKRQSETFNFSSKNFSCSLRRPRVHCERPAMRRSEIKIHAARLFSAVCPVRFAGRSVGRTKDVACGS